MEQVEQNLLDDGFGNKCSRFCDQCGKQSMFINRPGDFRCRYCYEEKWVVLDLEEFLESRRIVPEPAPDLKEQFEKRKKADKK